MILRKQIVTVLSDKLFSLSEKYTYQMEKVNNLVLKNLIQIFIHWFIHTQGAC